MVFKKKTATTETTATATADRNEPVEIAFETFSSVLSNTLEVSGPITRDFLSPDIPGGEALAKHVDSIVKKMGVEDKGPEAEIFYYSAKKQRLYGPKVQANADGLVVTMGDYRFIIDADTDITEKPYSFEFSTDSGGQLILDRGKTHLKARCFFDRKFDTKTSSFSARMISAVKASDISEFLTRGEQRFKWSERPEEESYMVHDIIPVRDRDDSDLIAYAELLVEVYGSDEVIRVYAPGDYTDYSGLEFPVQASRTGSVFKIGDKELTISSGGRWKKLEELTEGEDYKIIGFEGENVTWEGRSWWAATLIMSDGTKLNGNPNINKRLQGVPADAITSDKPATLSIRSISSYTKRNGKPGFKVITGLSMFGESENLTILHLKQKMEARMAQQKQVVAVGNPL